jgi:hypothetical protein
MTHTINVPLARKVLAQILAAPSRWKQGVWLLRPYAPEQQSAEDTVDNCETYGCFAGWAVVLSGVKTDWSNRPAELPPLVVDWMDEHYDYEPDGPEEVGVASVAAAQLGLNVEQKCDLFSGGNTLRDLYEYLEEFTEGEITVPDDLPEWADLDSDEMENLFAPDDLRFV